MVDRLVKSLGALAREREALQRKEQQLEHRQRALIKDFNAMLHGIGKPIKCPKCDRRFAHRLPLARHLSASHGMKKASSARKGVQARRTKRKAARAGS